MTIELNKDAKEVVEFLSNRPRNRQEANVRSVKIQFGRLNKQIKTEDVVSAFAALRNAGYGYISKRAFISSFGVREAAKSLLTNTPPEELKEMFKKKTRAVVKPEVKAVTEVVVAACPEELEQLRAENKKLREILANMYLTNILK